VPGQTRPTSLKDANAGRAHFPTRREHQQATALLNVPGLQPCMRIPPIAYRQPVDDRISISCPGRRTVEGKSGWFGESGNAGAPCRTHFGLVHPPALPLDPIQMIAGIELHPGSVVSTSNIYRFLDRTTCAAKPSSPGVYLSPNFDHSRCQISVAHHPD